MVRKSPKTHHAMSCCCAHAHLPEVGDVVKAVGRRTTILDIGDEVKGLCELVHFLSKNDWLAGVHENKPLP